VQPTHGLPSEWGRGRWYSPYQRPHGPTGSTAEAVQRISNKRPRRRRRWRWARSSGGVRECDSGPMLAQIRHLTGVEGSLREAQPPVTL